MGDSHMKVHISPWERGMLIRGLANFAKGIAFEHNNRVLGRRMEQAELKVMVPDLADSGRVKFLKRN
jgi:hypothetical protein